MTITTHGRSYNKSILSSLAALADADPTKHLSAATVNFPSRILGVDISPTLSADEEQNEAVMEAYRDQVKFVQDCIEAVDDFYVHHCLSRSEVMLHERLIHAKYILGHHAHINDAWRAKTTRQLSTLALQEVQPNYAALQDLNALELQVLAKRCQELGVTSSDLFQNNSVSVHSILHGESL